MRLALLSLLLLFTAAPQSGGGRSALLNREFKLKVGQEAVVRPGGLKVRFDGVVEDSRCPEGVNCIWAGNARITVRLRGAGGRPASVELNTGAEPRRHTHMQYEVELLDLSPYPKEGKATDRRSYVATLKVRGSV